MNQPRIIELANWLGSPAGQYVYSWEYKQISQQVANVFGYHAMQLGLPDYNFLQASRIRHKGRLSSQFEYGKRQGAIVIAEPEQLPFESQSIDLLVLPHTLECSTRPHDVLREVQRVLMPEGRVVISGFNPWSLWGIHERIPGLDPLLPLPAHQQVSPARLKDWFKLLSFEFEQSHFGCYTPPCETQAWLQRWAFLEKVGARWWPMCGAVYVITAKKRVAGMRLLGPAWRRAKMRKSPQGVVARQNLHSMHQEQEL